MSSNATTQRDWTASYLIRHRLINHMPCPIPSLVLAESTSKVIHTQCFVATNTTPTVPNPHKPWPSPRQSNMPSASRVVLNPVLAFPSPNMHQTLRTPRPLLLLGAHLLSRSSPIKLQTNADHVCLVQQLPRARKCPTPASPSPTETPAPTS